MDIEIMVVAIVSVVMFAAIIKQWLRTKEAKGDQAFSEDISKKLEKIEKLEQRVMVLEKIVTNKKVNLAEEIDSL